MTDFISVYRTLWLCHSSGSKPPTSLQVSLCGILRKQNGTGTGFEYFSFHCQFIPPVPPILISII